MKQLTCIRGTQVLLAGLVLFLIVALPGACAFRKQPLKWHLTLELDPTFVDRDGAVVKTVKVLENRLNAIGVNSFQLTPQHAGRILLDLSMVRDPERLKSIITAGGKLEVTHVISPPSPQPAQTYMTREEALASLNGGDKIRPDRRVLPFTERQDVTNTAAQSANSPQPQKWVVVESPAIIDGNDLRSAQAIPNGAGVSTYQITFSLNKDGAEKLSAWTGANINEYVAVVLNDQVKSIAFIKSQIFDQGEISGNFTRESAEDLALILKSGALPAGLKIVDERIDK